MAFEKDQRQIMKQMKNLAVVLIPKAYFDAMYVNKAFHPSRETILSTHISFVVPRGSPLQAINDLSNP